MRTRRIGIWMTAVVLAVGLLPAGAAAQPELKRLTIGTARDLQLGAQVGIAKHKGFYKAVGLDVDVAYFTSGAEMTSAMAAGRIPLGSFGDTPAVNMMAGKLPIKVVAVMAEISGTQQVVVRKGIRRPKDLIGKKVGLLVGSTSESILLSMLAHYQIPRKSVEVLNMGPPEQVAALARGDIDGLVVWQPFVLRAKKRAGGHALVSAIRSYVPGQEGPLDLYHAYAVLVARNEFLKKYPKTMKAVLRALIKAKDYINANKSDAARMMKKDMRQPVADLKVFLDENIYDMRVTRRMKESIERTIDFRHKVKKIKTKPNLDAFLDVSFLKEVAPGLVKYEPKR